MLLTALLPTAQTAKTADTLPFPYVWGPETMTADFAGATTSWNDWQYQPAYSDYRIFASKRDWIGKHLISAAPFALPEKSTVAFSFMYNTSSATSGGTLVDYIRFVPLAQPKDLPYTADWTEWEAYDPSDNFVVWEASADGMKAERGTPDPGVAYNKMSEGLLASPAIALGGNREVEVSFDYSLATASDELMVNLYEANVNHPDSFVNIKSFPISPDFKKASYIFTPESDISEWHIAIRSNMSRAEDELHFPHGYTLEVRNFRVAYSGHDGIDTNVAGGVAINGNRITADSGNAEIAVYDMLGTMVASGIGSVEVSVSGPCVIRIINDEKASALKHIF